MFTITPKELSELIKTAPESLELIDVRSTGEYDESHINWSKNIPLHILPMRINEVDKKKKVIMICRSGARSAQACMFAAQSGVEAYNLSGWVMTYEWVAPHDIIQGEVKRSPFSFF
jgi:rhodanese-related sulfurtransferase